jgi:hypothetical protein
MGGEAETVKEGYIDVCGGEEDGGEKERSKEEWTLKAGERRCGNVSAGLAVDGPRDNECSKTC